MVHNSLTKKKNIIQLKKNIHIFCAAINVSFVGSISIFVISQGHNMKHGWYYIEISASVKK